MRYFLDLKFIEYGSYKPSDLISVGILCEDGRGYYAINWHCCFWRANDWVLENVLLPIGLNKQGRRNPSVRMEGFEPFDRLYVDKADPFMKPKAQIKRDILDFVGYDIESNSLIGWDALDGKSLPDRTIELWYQAEYDRAIFCQALDATIGLPQEFLTYCRNIKELCGELGNPELPKQLKGEYDALADAKYIRVMYQFLRELERVRSHSG